MNNHFQDSLFGALTKTHVRLMCSLLVLLGLTSCDSEQLPSVEQKQHKISVVLMTPQEPESDPWSAAGLDGAERIKSQLNAHVHLVSNSDPNKVSEEVLMERIRPELEQGLRVVIGLGGQYEAFLRQLAERFKYTSVAVVGEVEGNHTNFGGAAGRFNDIGYVMGVLAAQQVESPAGKQVAFLGGIPFKAYQRMADAYESAVTEYQPDVEVLVDWVDSFSDPALSVDKAKALLDQGVKVLFINTGMGNKAVIELARKYPASRILVIDTEPRDEWNIDQVLATGIMDVAGIITQTAHMAGKGHWRGEQVWFSFEEEVAQIRFNSVLVGEQYQQQVADVIQQLKGGLVYGQLKVDQLESDQ
ncbi:BMP family ABC transporter substrate-binding protein [Oceanospirillum beijerinckii]|uniref:BMP family ABC transporter substrate-binding protein n=1 Tax=Oceanospirillum beijerinckii TaxID=64976 RepID=UPI000565CF8F|nr:BMP family ABC transporter substrate-binding protein [Oceanospirillum beijerinckii]